MNRELSIFTSNSEQPSEWDQLADLAVESSELAEVPFEFLPEEEARRVLRETPEESFKVLMRNPPERTIGLSDSEWNVVQAQMDNPENWPAYRRELHERIVAERLESCDSMSSRLRAKERERGDPATIYVLRGTCGAGKTTALRTGDRFPGVLDEDGQPTGALSADLMKIPLRNDGLAEGEVSRVSHTQVHQEAGVLNRRLTQAVHERAMAARDSGEGYSVVIDKLMCKHQDIVDVISDAESTERDLRVIDVDVPFELSAVRVLCRTAEGDDPQVPFENVAYSFRNIRTERSKLLMTASTGGEKSPIRSYELIVFNPATKKQETVFSAENGHPNGVTGPEAASMVYQAVSSPETTEAEISEARDTVITDEYIDTFIGKYFDESDEKSMQYAASTRATLEQFKGLTLADALDVRCGKKKIAPAESEAAA